VKGETRYLRRERVLTFKFYPKGTVSPAGVARSAGVDERQIEKNLQLKQNPLIFAQQ
jgi:hypothetical protein